MPHCHKLYGAMCGHGALAAALGKPVCETVEYFQRLMEEKRGCVSEVDMRNAIMCAGRTYRRHHARLPAAHLSGVVLLQFLGPWMERHHMAKYRYRHWVAFREGRAWDANLERWEPWACWVKWAETELFPAHCTGYDIVGAFEIHPA